MIQLRAWRTLSRTKKREKIGEFTPPCKPNYRPQAVHGATTRTGR